MKEATLNPALRMFVPGEPSTTLADEDLIAWARAGAVEAFEEIFRRYMGLVRGRAHTYFLAGADMDDVVQEGMIGLFEAIRDFREDRGSSFRSFAELCVTRQIIAAIRTATRNKHTPLNDYVSLYSSNDAEGDNSGDWLIGSLPTVQMTDPLEIVLTAEDVAFLVGSIEDALSELESEVLLLYLEGKKYQEIAERLGCQMKSIDNALQRIKRKMQAIVSSKEREPALAGASI